MPIIIDARETRPEVLELAERFARSEALTEAPLRRLRAAVAALIGRLRRTG